MRNGGVSRETREVDYAHHRLLAEVEANMVKRCWVCKELKPNLHITNIATIYLRHENSKIPFDRHLICQQCGKNRLQCVGDVK
jgi:hypothetical protein